MARTRHKLHIFYLWPISVTLTFDIESWVLYSPHLLIMIKFEKVIWKCNNNFWSYSPDKVGRTDARPHGHTKVANCGDYVSFTARGSTKIYTCINLQAHIYFAIRMLVYASSIQMLYILSTLEYKIKLRFS